MSEKPDKTKSDDDGQWDPASAVTIDLNDPTIQIGPEDTVAADDDEPIVPTTKLVNDFTRYDEFKRLGEGGIGIVTSCLDPHLGRRVAVKTLKAVRRTSKELRTRFVREARVMAQMEHPNIMPVHELGTRPDGSIYFSMKLVDGVTLRQVIKGLRDKDPTFVEEYNWDRLFDVFVHVCEAVAFAHNCGVLHRDLKPDNILIGAFGEVLLLDWGLAKLVGEEEDVGSSSDDNLDELLDLENGTTTLEGAITGTPLYMAPEQAFGRVSEIDQRTDLYSLGVILYEILTLERPHVGENVRQIILAIGEGNIIPPRKRGKCRFCIAPEIDAICMKALAKEQEDRYPSVHDFLEDLEHFHSGRSVSVYRDSLPRLAWKFAKRHAVLSSSIAASLLALIIGATMLMTARVAKRGELLETADLEYVKGEEAHFKRMTRLEELNELKSKLRQKEKPQRELELEREVAALTGTAENHFILAQRLYNRASGLGFYEADEGIKQIFSLRVVYALAKEDHEKLKELIALFRQALGQRFEKADPDLQARLRRLAEMSEGIGSLAVASRPAGLDASLWRYAEGSDGCLRPVFQKALGKTPVAMTQLPMGSYLVVLNQPSVSGIEVLSTVMPLPPAPAKGVIYYPVQIDHAEEEHASIQAELEAPAGMVYVAGGRARLGGNASRNLRLHDAHLDSFFIKDSEVTFGEYLQFWTAPDGGNRKPELKSRIRFARDEYRFVDAWDDAGKLHDKLTKDLPLVGIPCPAAMAYCKWLGKKLGRTVRLPTALEWEKAARGVDGRNYVWGNRFDARFAFVHDNAEAGEKYGFWAPPKSFPQDLSVYGAYDLAGNVREWTSSKFPQSPYYQIKGGSGALTRRFAQCAYSSDTPVVPSDVGFRYAMEVSSEW